MKKFLFLIILYFIFTTFTFAQEITPIPLECSLDLYEGTWKYENTGTKEVFIIKLKKFDNYIGFSNHGTVIIGEYSYTKNNITIHDSLNNLQYVVSNDDAFYSSIFGQGDHKNKIYNKLQIWVSDRTYIKLISGTLKYALSRFDQTLIWQIAENEKGDFDVGPDYVEGVSIPTKAILIKVEE